MFATDLNNNILPDRENESDLENQQLPEQTELGLSFRDGCLHVFNPLCKTWISVNELHPDKKAYLYSALASNISSVLKNVVSAVKRQLHVPNSASTVLEFLSAISMEFPTLATGDEKSVYSYAFNSVQEQLSKFDDLHDDLDSFYQKLASNSKDVGSSVTELNMNDGEKCSAVLEKKIFISVPWDWESSFLTAKELPAFSNMTANAKQVAKNTGSTNPSIGKLFKKQKDRVPPPMEPTWMKIDSGSAAEQKGLDDSSLGIPCIVLRKLGLFYGNNGEQFHDYDLVLGSQFKGTEDLMNHLLPSGSPDMIQKAHISHPVAFRYLEFQHDRSLEALTEEVDSPRLLELGPIVQAIKGLTTGCLNSIYKTDQWMLRTLQLLESQNDEFLFQRAIQNIHFYGNYEQSLQLTNGVERISDQTEALRLLAASGSDTTFEMLRLFNTITKRLDTMISTAKNASAGGVSATSKEILLGKCELNGEDPFRLNYEAWHRSASTVAGLTELSATKKGAGGRMIEQLQEVYQHVGFALLLMWSNYVDGMKLSFENCIEAVCALMILAENLASQGYTFQGWLVKDLSNTLEETMMAITALKQSIHRVVLCSEVMQTNTSSALGTLQEITMMRRKQYEKLKKQEARGSWCFNFFRKSSK